jgi:chromosome segregation ATPase
MISLNDQLRTSEQQKQRLRSEFNSVLQQQQQLAMNRYAGQAQAQQQQQAGAVSTDVALEQAKNRLDELGRQKQALFNEAEQAQRRVDQLQSERSELLNQPQ